MKGIKWISLFLVLSLMVPIVLAEDVRIVLQGEKNSYIAGENIVVKVFIEAEDFTYPFGQGNLPILWGRGNLI